MGDDEKSSTSWLGWTLKFITSLVIAMIPTMGVLYLLLAVGFVPAHWIGTPFLLSLGVFFLGTMSLLHSGNIRHFGYSLGFGFLIGVGTIALVVIVYLSLISLPVVGNAANLAFVCIAIGGGFLSYLWTSRHPIETGTTTTTAAGMITPSAKILPTQRPTSGFSWKQPKMVTAIELEEIPRNYVYPEEGKRDPMEWLPRFQSIVRHLTLTSVPFGLRFERVNHSTRVLFLTWANDVALLNHQKTVLFDTLRSNLSGFKFHNLGSFSGIQVGEEQAGAAVLINGVPLSIDDERQRKDSIDPVASILQQMNNSIIQFFVEPSEIKDSNLRSLDSQYRRAVESSETTRTKDKHSWIYGEHSESTTIVDPKAKRKAELLQRKIERMAGRNLCNTTVSTVSWGADIGDADLNARRLASAIIGAVQPDSEQEDFDVKYVRKQKDVRRLLAGEPVGKESVLTPAESTVYFVLPKVDIGIRVTTRESFSSGTKESIKKFNPQEKREKFECRVPTKVKWVPRHVRIFYGNPLNENGEPIEKSYITSDIQYFDSHFFVVGNTRKGKTYSAISVVGQAIALGVNPVVLLPSKAYEWRLLLDIFPDLRVFTAGDSDTAILSINIWDPPPGVPLTKWVDRIVQILTLWLPNDRVLSMHVEDVVYTLYSNCGWDLKTGKKGRAILLEDLVDAVREVIESIEYDDEVNRNFRGALIARVKSILRKPALVEMFNTKKGLTITELLAHPTVIEMDHLSHNDKILLMGVLTAAMCEYKLANPTKHVSNILVLEEAHYLLGRTDVQGEANSGARLQAISALIEMLRVLGGTGLGVMLINQLPSNLVTEAVKLPVNVIIHQLSSQDERELVGKHARCTDAQIEHIGGMERGEAVVFLEGEGEPKNVKIYPLSRLIGSKLPQRNPDNEAVRKHMAPKFQANPELKRSEPLPADILTKLNSKKVENLSTDEDENLSRFIDSKEFMTFCRNRIKSREEHDIDSLAEFLCDVAREKGNGTTSFTIQLAQLVVDSLCETDCEDFLQKLVSSIIFLKRGD
ncbi:MAG: hypothetical protein ACFFF4_06835 [Candidatus Thorarchaeota archaeon]